MRKAIAILLAVLIAGGVVGCESLRKKFTPKKKGPVKMPRLYQVKKYEARPAPELYRKHYAYWMSWHSELIRVLGENHKKDSRCIEEIVGNLQDMQGLLTGQKADELTAHIAKLSRVKDAIFKEDLTQANKVFIVRTLEREDRFIKKEFCYTKVKDYLRKGGNGEPGKTK